MNEFEAHALSDDNEVILNGFGTMGCSQSVGTAANDFKPNNSNIPEHDTKTNDKPITNQP